MHNYADGTLIIVNILFDRVLKKVNFSVPCWLMKM